MAELLLTGTLVGLRQLTLADVGDRYLRWMRDPTVVRYLESRFAEHSEETLRDYVRGIQERSDTALLAIIELRTRSHVGNIKIGPLNPHHATAELGLLIGDRDVQSRGYGTEAIRLATLYGFDRMGARKLTASCYGTNAASAAAFRRAGWTEEGRRPAQFVGIGGIPEDQMLFGTFRR